MQARYLFVLALLVTDPAQWQLFTESGTGLTPPAQPLAGNQLLMTYRRIAQWAINAVCYSTPDSAMAPFKYPLPGAMVDQNGHWINGWPLKDYNLDPNSSDPNKKTSDPQSNFDVVWGCKPPELVLTETLAFHDRRVADTNKDDGVKKTREDQDQGKPADPTLDQTRNPTGFRLH